MNKKFLISTLALFALSASPSFADEEKNDIDEVVAVASKLDQVSSQIDIDPISTSAPTLKITLNVPTAPKAPSAPAAPAPVAPPVALISAATND